MLGGGRASSSEIDGNPKEPSAPPEPRGRPLGGRRRWRGPPQSFLGPGHVPALCTINSRNCTRRLHPTGEVRQLGAPAPSWGAHIAPAILPTSAETGKKSDSRDVS